MRIFRSQKMRKFSSTAVEQSRERSLLADPKSTSQWYKAKRSFSRHWQLYLMMLPALLYFFVFKYIPMAGAVIAFKEYNVVQGIWGSSWVGFRYVKLFFQNPVFWTLLKNTLGLSLYSLVVGFPIPIILAICLNAGLTAKAC